MRAVEKKTTGGGKGKKRNRNRPYDRKTALQKQPKMPFLAWKKKTWLQDQKGNLAWDKDEASNAADKADGNQEKNPRAYCLHIVSKPRRARGLVVQQREKKRKEVIDPEKGGKQN